MRSFLTRKDLLPLFRQQLAEARAVDVAVAWLSPSKAFEHLVQVADEKPVRVVAGLAGNATHPGALRQIQPKAGLRLSEERGGTFHPKVFLFHQGDKTVAWVGSANLTHSGFSANREAVAQFSDNGEVKDWFEGLWASLPSNTETRLAEYEKHWSPPSGPGRGRPGRKTPNSLPLDWFDPEVGWAGYLEALSEADAYWSETEENFTVFGDEESYLVTISLGRDLTHRGSWELLSEWDQKVLLGSYPSGSAGFGHLGSMTAAGSGGTIFTSQTREKLRVRERIHNSLLHLHGIDTRDFPEAGREAFEAITSEEGVGSGMATRLITLARPDVGISVNSASRDGLAHLTGIPASRLERGVGYEELLRWVQDRPWHAAPSPDDPWEQEVWEMRAALLDCFVYQP